jgi:hypothetical protein
MWRHQIQNNTNRAWAESQRVSECGSVYPRRWLCKHEGEKWGGAIRKTFPSSATSALEPKLAPPGGLRGSS